MKVKDLMTREVKCCADYNSLNTAAQTMWEHQAGEPEIAQVLASVCALRHRVIQAQAA